MIVSPNESKSKRPYAGAGVIIAIIALLTVAVVYASTDQTASQTTDSSSSTTSMTSKSVGFSSPTSSSFSGIAVGGCSTSVYSSEDAFSLRTAVDSSAMVCVRYYYYNQTAPLQLYPSLLIKIFGWYPGLSSGSPPNSSLFNANSNFTITAQPSSILIGGPTNENEGVEVNYTITANAGTRGTYDVSVGQFLLPDGLGCSGQFLMASGNGLPDYGSYSHTLMCAALPTNNTSFPYTPGFLLAQIVGATNSSALAGQDL